MMPVEGIAIAVVLLAVGQLFIQLVFFFALGSFICTALEFDNFSIYYVDFIDISNRYYMDHVEP